MEGDAGAGRLNPIDADDTLNTQATSEDSEESVGGAEPVSHEPTTEEPSEATVEDSPESEESQHGPQAAGDHNQVVERGPSRLRRGWLVGIAAVLVLCAGAVGTGGYLALHFHRVDQAIARDDAKALKAALDCVSVTQAPDTQAMAASEQKIIDCGTDAYRSQALLYTGMLVQAYQAANVHVTVSDARAAVERHNRDGSVDVLVALRVKVANDATQNETGYRLRVKMALAEGQYKISKLDQVTK
ncbi:Mce protein [Mycobacterium parmense]|uniref:Uncharacterized protein n=1 Tax=Mycobacterium parmense TaxID=185642 RepID=A0A7I7YZM7_9MYCO|nr:Mce protein [Mycobacterium parmense]MCV7353474.1 Mce protein [Mycobacterium parmense]ORW55260.1 Mce protein [Mycobacterium parmense]BBZ46343.1 hypothetical protein MPRM_36240 [Mycobacterium parmense]